MCSNINFDYNSGTGLWTPTDATVTSYVPALDENSFTAEVDSENYYRGLYTDAGETIRRSSLTIRLLAEDVKSLLAFRKIVRTSYFEAKFKRIDPFLSGNPDSTQTVRILGISKPARTSVKYYSTTIGFIK